jgi:hypothetical protein
MTVRTIDEIFRDFVTDGVPASGPFNPHKPDIRDTLKALAEGGANFPDNRVIRLNNADEGTANNIIVTASVAIPAAVYQVLYILNVTQENTGPVAVSGAISRSLVTNTNRPIEAGYLQPGMALLCVDTGTELRLLSYGDAKAIAAAAEAAADRAEAAAASINLPLLQPGDAGKTLIVNDAENGYELGISSAGYFDSKVSVEASIIHDGIDFIHTAGFYAAGDGGSALYVRVSSEPSHNGKIQSADGAWWKLSTEYVTPNMFGAKCNGTDDDAPAINSAWSYANSLTTIGAALNLVANKVYYVGTSIQLGPYSGKQRLLEGNGAHIRVLPSFTGYMFDSDNSSGIFAWMIGLRNFTAEGIYGSSNTNFIRARHVNGLNLDFVFLQSFNLAFNLADSYAVSIRNTHLRYIKQHAFFTSTSSMQLKLIDCRVYGMNSGDGVAANPLFINTAANANIIMIGCDFEGGKSNFFYTSQPVRQLSITGSYIEGFDLNPLSFDGAVTAFVFEGNWLGYNAGTQQWKNVKSGRISGNVFAQQTTTIGTGNGDVFQGNNAYIDGANVFSFRVVGATMETGATAVDLPGYKRTPDGVTYLSGRLTRTGNGNLFILPDGYRPKVDTSIATFVEGGFTQAIIDISSSTGMVSVRYSTGGGGIRLDGMAFLS